MFGNPKIKYKKALALQKMERDQDGVYVESDGELSVDQMVQKKMSSDSCGYRWYRMGFSRHPRRFVL